MLTQNPHDEAIRFVAHQRNGRLVAKPLYAKIIRNKLGRPDLINRYQEDVLQDAAMALAAKHAKGALTEGLTVEYAKRLVSGIAVDTLRRELTRQHQSIDAAAADERQVADTLAARHADEPESTCERREYLRRIAAFVRELDPSCKPREAFELRSRHAFDTDAVRRELQGRGESWGAHREAYSQAVKHISRRLADEGWQRPS